MGDLARVGCIGDLLVELVSTTRNGRHKRPGAYTGPYPSGAAGIFIDQAAQVGGRCIFVGAVGDDAFGEVVLERLVRARRRAQAHSRRQRRADGNGVRQLQRRRQSRLRLQHHSFRRGAV